VKTIINTKIIRVSYWHSPIPEIKYIPNQEFPYSNRQRSAIIDHVLEKGCSVMIRPMDNGILIWIDRERFGQR